MKRRLVPKISTLLSMRKAIQEHRNRHLFLAKDWEGFTQVVEKHTQATLEHAKNQNHLATEKSLMNLVAVAGRFLEGDISNVEDWCIAVK